MKDENKTKRQLIDELAESRQRISELEAPEDERLRALQDLLDSAQLLETILDHTHMLVAYMDPQFNFVKVNRAYAEADERDPSFFPGKNHFDLYPNAENESIFGGAVQTGDPYFESAKPFEYAEHPERGVSYWDWSLMPIKSSEGQVTGLVFTLLDVTERKRAEEAMRESEEKFRAVVEQSADGVVLIDEQGAIIEWNRAQEQITGLKRSDVLGQPVWDVQFKLWPEEKRTTAARERIKAGTLELLKGGQAPGYGPLQELEMEVPDGSRKVIQASIVPIKTSKAFIVAGVNRDITSQKRAEEALQESEEKFRGLAEQSPNMIFINHKGRVVYANEKGEEVLGYTREEFYSADFDFSSLIAPECIDLVEAAYGKHMKGEDVPPYEYTLLTREGTRIEAIIATRLVTYNGESAILGVVTDITGRKQAEERLRILSSVVEQSARSIAVLDKEGVVQYANQGLLSLYQISADEVVGKNWRSFMSEDSTLRDDFPEIRSTVLDGGMAWKGEFSDRSVGGELAWREATVFPIKDDAGEVAHVVYSSEDATERKRAEEALRVSELRFRSLVEQTTDGVFCYEYDPPIPTDLPVEEQVASLCRGILVECNDVCARAYGATRAQEVIGGELTELFGTSSGSLDDFFRAFIENGCRAVDLELTEVLDDGTVRYYSNTGHGVVEDGMLLRVWGTFRDVTARKRAEEALRKSEERFKGIFENALVGQYRTTPDGRILMGNPALARMLGYSSFEELAQRNLEEDGYEPEYPRSAFKERIESERQVVGLESAWIRRDGTAVYVRESARAIRDEAGNTLYYEGTVEDITERKAAEEEIRRRNEELVALNAIAETVSQSLDLTDILEGALDKVLEIMRVEAGGIYLADEARQRATLRAHRGVSGEFAREVGDLAIDEETVRRVDELGRAGKLILASELLLRDRTLLKAVTTAIAREKLRSYVQVLIRVKGSPVGLLVVASRDGRKFAAQEEELLSTIANQIGVGIENARLYQAEKRRLSELEALRHTTLDITKQLDLGVVLHSIASRAAELLGGTSGGLYLYRPEQDVLEWAVAVGAGVAPVGSTLRRGDGLSGKVWETGQPLIVDDYSQWEGRATIFEDYPLEAVVAVPVRFGEKFLGVLNVLKEAPEKFSPAEAELLSLLAHQAAIAIENARLYEAMQARTMYLETLQEINATLRSTLPLNDVLGIIVRRTTEALGYIGCTITLPDATGERLVVGAAWGGRLVDAALRLTGLSLESFGLPLKVKDNLIARAFHTGQLQTSRGEPEGLAAGSEPSISPKIARAIERATGAKSAACVPLRVAERTVGVLVVTSPREQLSDEERAMLLGLGDQAALAVENAKLYQEQAGRLAEMMALYETSLDVIGQLELPKLLRSIVERASNLLSAAGGAIWLYHPEDHELEVAVDHNSPVDQTGVRLKMGEGLVGKVIEVGEALAVEDYRHWEGRSERFDQIDYAGVVGVPLRLKGEIIGVITVNEIGQPRRFTDHDLRLLTLLANQAAIAIENARLYEAVQARTMYLETLQRINATLRSTLPLNEVLETIVQGATQALGYTGTFILIPDESTQRLVLGAVSGGRFVDATLRLAGLELAQFSLPLKVEENPMAQAFLTGELQILSGPPDRIILGVEPAVSPSVASAIQSAMGAEGAACVPLRAGEKAVGALVVISPREQLAEEERIMLLGLADQAALAIENARLYEETKRRAGELAALYEVSLEVTGQLDLQTVLNAVAQRATDLLGGPAGGLYLYDPQRQELELIAGRFLERDYTGLRLAMGEGACGKVAQSGEALVVTAYHEWEGRSSQFDEGQEYNVLAVPIKRGATLLGALYFNSPDLQESFDETDIRLATLFANYAAVAIENARLYEETERRAEELAALYDVSLEVASQLEVPALLQTVVHRAMGLLEGDGCGFYAYDEERQELEFIAAEGLARRRLGETLALGEGASGKTAQTGQPVLVMDYATWEGRSPQYADEPSANMLAVPVKTGDVLSGVLYVYDQDLERRFDEGDIRLATLFANHAAVAMENARLYEETGRRAEELAALYDVSLELASQLELPTLLETVVERAMDLTGVQGGGLYLYDPDRQDLELITGRGVAEAYKGVRLALGEGASGKVAQSGEPMFVTDYANWEGASPQWGDAPDSNILAVPIKRGDALLGVLYVYGQHMERDFDENDLHLATLFGNQAAIAIENARLYEARERRSDELMALYETSLDITSRLDPDSLLKAIIGRAVKLLDGRSGDAYLYRPAEGDLASAASVGMPAELQGTVMKAGDGFAGRVLVTGEPLVVEDYESWEGQSDRYTGYGFGRVLGAPIRYGTELLGVLVLERSLEKPEFKEADVDLLTLFASQAAIAIENARLYQERTRRAEELATLYDISLEVTGKTELPEVLSSLVQEAAQLLTANAGGIDLFDPQTQDLELKVSFGYEKDYTGTRLALGEGLAGKVAQNKEPMMVDDYSAWEGRSPQWEEETLLATLAVPLLRGDDLLGVLSLGRRVPKPFDDNDLQLGTLFANQAAIAIENARLFDSVKSHQTDLQRLSAQLINSQEEERKRISQELHDEMGQALTAMSINLAAIEKELSSDRASAVGERLAETDGLIEQTLDKVRDLALDLRPSMLDDLGLVPTLRWYVKRYAARLNIDVEFEAINLEERLHAETETVLYRTVQEALTNVARHAHAGRVDVRLQRRDSTVTVSIEDDGRGFDVEKVGERELQERGAGLLGMRERVASLGGSLSIQSAEGQGTRLSIEIPLPRRAHDEQDKSASGRGSHHRS